MIPNALHLSSPFRLWSPSNGDLLFSLYKETTSECSQNLIWTKHPQEVWLQAVNKQVSQQPTNHGEITAHYGNKTYLGFQTEITTINQQMIFFWFLNTVDKLSSVVCSSPLFSPQQHVLQNEISEITSLTFSSSKVLRLQRADLNPSCKQQNQKTRL